MTIQSHQQILKDCEEVLERLNGPRMCNGCGEDMQGHTADMKEAKLMGWETHVWSPIPYADKDEIASLARYCKELLEENERLTRFHDDHEKFGADLFNRFLDDQQKLIEALTPFANALVDEDLVIDEALRVNDFTNAAKVLSEVMDDKPQ